MSTSPGHAAAAGPPPLKIGFIGLGEQGLPMAVAIAEYGFALHVWARRPASLVPLAQIQHTAHDTVASLAAAVDVVALCVSTDDDVQRMVRDDILPALPRGGIIVNHGTGTPANAAAVAALCAAAGVGFLDAPVSGGRPAAEARILTVLAGVDADSVDTATPVFRSFATHIVHVGATGAGQMSKLLNNALLMLNQAAIADILELITQAGLRAPDVVDALRLGSADSRALQLMNTMVNPHTLLSLVRFELS